jgi:isoquinoline 1-oxidoreductase alpha subunit
MLMAAAALLQRTPKPTDADIDAAMTNICRCGTYNRVRAGIKMAAGIPTTGAGSTASVVLHSQEPRA